MEDSDESKELKEDLRGGVLKYPPNGPLAVHFDGDVRWSFGCCGCRPMTPDSPELEAVPHETTTVYQFDAESRQSEDATILSPTQSPLVDEHRSKWYSRPVDATKLQHRLRDLLQSKLKSKRFKDKKGDIVSIEVSAERTGDHRARPLRPSEVLMTKIDSHKTRSLKSKSTGVWVLSCGGLRGGGLDEDENEEMEVDYLSPLPWDDGDGDERYISVSPLSAPDSNSEEEFEESWEYPEDDVVDEQEMDYELSVDLLPLENEYGDLRERVREEHQQPMKMVDRSRADFPEDGPQMKRSPELRPVAHKTRTSTGARLKGEDERDSEEDLDYDPNVENVAPILYNIDNRKLGSQINSICDTDMEDFPPLPFSWKDLPEPATHETNRSSPTYSPEVPASPSSISSADSPSKSMWVMVHPDRKSVV